MLNRNRIAFRGRFIVTALFASGLALGVFAADETAMPPGVAVTLKGHTETVYGIAFSPDGKAVATASFDKSIKLWDTATGKPIKSPEGQQGHQNLVLSVAFSPDGQSLATGSSDNTAKIWDVPSGIPLREFAHADGVNAVSLSPDGKTLA